MPAKTNRLAFALLLAACSRKADPAPPLSDAPLESHAETADARDAGPKNAPSVATSAAPLARTRVSPEEARRVRLAKLSDRSDLPAAAFAPRLGTDRGYEVQDAELGIGGRHAVLVTTCPEPCKREAADSMLVVVDGEGRPVWQKERPVAGILAPAYPLALSGGPRGRVALAACDPPTKSVALRLWDADGSPFADYQALEMDTCDDVSLLHWPRHGFVIVAVSVGVTRARYVTDEGALAWVKDVGARSRPDALAPASLAADTDETFVLVQVVQPTAEKGSAFHALAFRYDLRGEPVWRDAVDLGALARAPTSRVRVEPSSPAGVHVVAEAAAQTILDVDVKPSGALSLRGRAPK